VPSSWILAERQRIPEIDAFLSALARAAADWPFTMGWIDCLTRGRHMGRGVLHCGRWATSDEAPSDAPRPLARLSVPVECPAWVSGHPVARAFNEGIYRVSWSRRAHVQHPAKFFYPLDILLHWNRLYGRRGFTQYQCVLPSAAGPGAVRELLERLTTRGAASFLCVIKDCGDEGEGLLSFPMRGTSVALDLPVRDDTQQVVDALNEFVVSAGGRIYLAKDAFTRPEHYRAMEPRLDEWLAIRRRWDPEGRLRSAQSVRLLGDRP
jgi:decaprenylphospho-beta-D-ribofuranose 2-oxidase